MAAQGGVPQFASLYVGDLHPDVTEAMLYEIFNSVGPVGSIRVCRNSVTRKSLGYGYVNFHSVSDAERALDTLNYSSIKGRACRIMWSQRDPSLRKSGVGNIFVKNLDRNIDNKALYDTFSLFGNILSCKVSTDHNGKSRGYGFVHYETEEAAKQAIERVNGMQIGDMTVEVTSFLKRDDRDTPKSAYTNLYTKSFPQDWEENKLKEMFAAYGKITSSVMMEDKLGRKFAFINFDETESAQKSVQELHGKDMRTDEQKAAQKEEDIPELYLMYVGRAQTKGERAREVTGQTGGGGGDKKAGVNLYVKNLDGDIDDAGLKELFEPYGTVTSTSSMQDDKGKCKGFGFVCFASADDATKAVTEMHLKVVKSKPLYVGLAERKDDRQERLRQRYQPGPMGGKGDKGGKGGGMGMGMGGSQMGGMCGMGGMGGPMGMGMGQQMMMGKGPMMGGMMGGKGGPMMGGPMMGGMMGGKGGPMMGGPMMGGMMGGPGGKGGPMMGAGMMGGPMMMGGKPGMGMMPQMMMGGKGGPMGMTNMGMMRPMMQMQQGMQKGGPMQQAPMQMPPAPAQGGSQLTAASLAAAPPTVQKQMLGEKLYPAISRLQPEMAGKITGMMLEMDNSELLILLESESQLKAKVDEAMRVLQK
eukprot:CAMPEP_0204120978 /NCGR_PEP_ID=MMETSP0361-20130328/7949_1 /ASSEMBLY_ACC=CAM_ASM_000343 /TAXON_ID=268821 /ORGANISM="Scrippsiella Hangoei, Strain SHTV-5" /LENGTH=640 /DNA_ID=CAMNT_0051072239 /DNA_START=54 /DNA_END=1976 /DNA_ORIENTATION=+